MRRIKKILTGVLVVLALICIITGAGIVTFKSTGLRFCTVDGHSMDYTLHDGERLLLNPSAKPQFDDIIVFNYSGTYLIKRVIGLPGDTVMVVNGVLYVNNVKYDEPYLTDELVGKFKDSSFVMVVNDDEYFVMGDNRDNSRDSRHIGCVPKDAITGVAIWRF